MSDKIDTQETPYVGGTLGDAQAAIAKLMEPAEGQAEDSSDVDESLDDGGEALEGAEFEESEEEFDSEDDDAVVASEVAVAAVRAPAASAALRRRMGWG